MLTTEWEYAVIGPEENLKTLVNWMPGRHLPEELIPIAMNLGYKPPELATYSVGELKEDIVYENFIYLKGAIVLPDEHGYPAALFGRPLVKFTREPCQTTRR